MGNKGDGSPGFALFYVSEVLKGVSNGGQMVDMAIENK